MSPDRRIGTIEIIPGYSAKVPYKGKKYAAVMLNMPIPPQLVNAIDSIWKADKLRNPEEAIYQALENMITVNGGKVRW